MKTDDVRLDVDVSGILEVGDPQCRAHFRRVTVLGASLVAFFGGMVVEPASADDWSAVDAGFAAPPAEFLPQTRSTPHCPSRRGV